MNLNVASWNIEGIKKHTESINELIETYSPDIICLQEIQTLQLEEHHYNNIIESYSTVFNTQDKYRKGLQKIQLSKNRQHFGTSISTKTKYDKQIKLLNTKIHNIQAMKLNIGEDNILFLNIYMPTSGQDIDYKKVLNSIKEIIKTEDDDTMIIATGDLNTRPDKNTPRNRWLKDFLKELNLTLHTPSEKTHRSHRWGTETTLDYVITSRHITNIKLNVLNNIIFPNNLSSHYPIITNIQLNISHKDKIEKDNLGKNQIFKNHKKIDWERVDKDLYKRLAEIKIRKTEAYRGIITEDSLNMIRTDILVKAAEDAYYKKKPERHVPNPKLTKDITKKISIANKRGDK